MDGQATTDFVKNFNGQKMDEIPGFGVMDTSRRGHVDGVNQYRSALGAFTFVNAAGVATLAKGSVVKLFTAGPGESGSDAGLIGNLTDADTDAFTGGALAIDGWRFIVKSIGFQFEDPFNNGVAATRSEEHAVAGYRASFQRALARDVAVSVSIGDDVTAYKLGALGLYPSPLGMPTTSDFASIGAPFVNNDLALAAAIRSAPKSGSAKMVVTLTTTRDILIGARAAPITANTLAPVRCVVLGHPVPAVGSIDGIVCAPGEIDYDKLAEAQERRARKSGRV